MPENVDGRQTYFLPAAAFWISRSSARTVRPANRPEEKVMGWPIVLEDVSSSAGCGDLAALIEPGEPSEWDVVMSGAAPGVPGEWLAGAAIVEKS
jgi:hypothetical protein